VCKTHLRIVSTCIFTKINTNLEVPKSYVVQGGFNSGGLKRKPCGVTIQMKATEQYFPPCGGVYYAEHVQSGYDFWVC